MSNAQYPMSKQNCDYASFAPVLEVGHSSFGVGHSTLVIGHSSFDIQFLSSIMKIAGIISFLESVAPPWLQEHYDNAGLITGAKDLECKGLVCSLDATEEVVKEAI